ncbi:Hypothetical_protein [Hexamita inflata]|uniref:Hypothetical_protein n=1 Tax=Hexamita inflata TaxID=28002 RepID=A0AA86UAC5_9EUKA|nr:Hypothetical protein HINF_LOCUS10120 [Hexamita inflata]CAI9947574.1 Hypothetical protein HINF_LOCUS35219 [Hexamita inflata]
MKHQKSARSNRTNTQELTDQTQEINGNQYFQLARHQTQTEHKILELNLRRNLSQNLKCDTTKRFKPTIYNLRSTVIQTQIPIPQFVWNQMQLICISLSLQRTRARNSPGQIQKLRIRTQMQPVESHHSQLRCLESIIFMI